MEIILWVIIGLVFAFGNMKILHKNMHLLAKFTGESE
jgi:hypothetical protein